jgi:hypothetical protein
MYKEREEYQDHCTNEHMEDEVMLDSSGMPCDNIWEFFRNSFQEFFKMIILWDLMI